MNSYGNRIKVELFGESHGEGIGVIIDGLPSGTAIDMDYITACMNRRKSDGVLGTKRIEDDNVEILSGVYNGMTTGTPLAVLIRNNNKKSSSYNDNVVIPRPSHADYTANIKYRGYADMRGGGHFSGRLTAPLVFAGAICSKILQDMGIDIGAHIYSIANVNDTPYDKVNIDISTLNSLKKEKIPCLDYNCKDRMIKEIEDARDKGDSVGGIIECAILGVDAGIGSPFFNSIESAISSIVFSVPAVKGVEFGSGFQFALMTGSEANDQYHYDNDKVKTITNNNGGVLGGLTNGMPVIFRCVIKPTPSIFIQQNSINLIKCADEKLTIEGRHDPCIVLRVVPVIEAVAAIAMLDMVMDDRSYR